MKNLDFAAPLGRRVAAGVLLALAPALAAAQCPAVMGVNASVVTSTTVFVGGNFTVPQASSFTFRCTPTAGGTTRLATVAAGAILTSPHVTGLLPATAYAGQVVSNCAGGQTSAPASFTFTTTPPPPANDDCAAAALLPETAACSSPTAGSLVSATPSVPPGGPGQPGDTDVWYRFVATGPAQVLTVTTQVDIGLDLWDVPCAALAGAMPIQSATVGIAPPPGSNGGILTTQLSDLTSGHPYYLRVFTINRFGVGPFTLCLNPGPPAPPNDACAGAHALAFNGPTTCSYTNGTVAGATPTPGLAGTCASSSTPVPRDVWYQFVAPNPRVVLTLTDVASPRHLTLELYTGTCASPGAVVQCASSNLNGPPSPGELDLYNATVGQAYLVRIYAEGTPLVGTAANFTLCAKAQPVCAEPFLLTAVPAATSAQLNWVAFGRVPLAYFVEYGPPGFALGTGNRTTATTTSPVLNGLRPNTDYCYYVQGGCDAGDYTAWVGPSCFRTTAAPAACLPPTNLSVSPSNTSANVSWQAAAIGNSFFEMEYGPAGFTPGTGTVVTSLYNGVSYNTAFLNGLLPSTDYCSYVRRDCGDFVGPECFRTLGPATLPDLLVSTAQTLPGGAYHNVTITGTGDLALTGDLSVAGALTVQTGGTLRTAYAPTALNPSGAATLIGPGSFELQDGAWLTIGSGAGISASGSTGTVQLRGGRAFSPGATYQYEGMPPARQQQLTGNGLPAQVRSLRVGSAVRVPDVQLTQALAVREVLALSNGSLVTAGHALTLLSDASGTALLVNNGTGTVVGNATVERYNSSAYRGSGYRHYSSPVSNATIGSLATAGFTPVVNGLYNSVGNTVRPFPTVFGFGQHAVFERGWASPTALTDPMTVGYGYTVQIPATQTVRFTGPLNQTQLSFGLANHSGATGAFYLLGNPFPAPLDWSTMTVGSGPFDNLYNVGAAVYVFEASGPYTGSYRTAVAGVGGAPVIASGQGFFVRTGPIGLGAYYFNLFNRNRVTAFRAADNTFHRPAAETRPLLTLALRDAAATLPADPASIYFTTAATAGFDLAHDAAKLPNTTGLNLASRLGGEDYAINGLPPLGAAPLVLPLAVSVPAAGRYALAVDQLLNFAPGTTLCLRDALLNTRTPLTAATRYAFALAGTTAPGRFSVEFGAAGALASAAQLLEAQVQVWPNPATSGAGATVAAPAGARVTLLNALGQAVRPPVAAGPTGTLLLPTARLAAGLYVVRVSTAASQVSRRLVLE